MDAADRTDMYMAEAAEDINRWRVLKIHVHGTARFRM